MGAFDDITSRYGSNANSGNAFEDITTEYGYDADNVPKPTLWDGIKNNAEWVANGVSDKANRAVNQVETTATNMKNTLGNWWDGTVNAVDAAHDARRRSISNAVDAYRNGEIDATELDEDGYNEDYKAPDYDEKSKAVYNQVVGRPAGYLAITPYVHPYVRGAAGILAAPTIIGDAQDMYAQNSSDYAEGNTENIIADSPALTTAKGFLIDPIANPIGRAIDSPGEFAQNIVDNPFNAWDDVFLPAGMIHGVTPKRVSRAIGERVGRVGEYIKEKATNAFEDIGERFTKNEPKFEEGVMYNAFDDIPVPEEVNAVEPREYSEGGLNGQPMEGETGNIQADIYNRYRQHGLSDVEAAALTGNIGAESSFSTTALSGDGYGSRGLIQFTDGRLNGENGLLKFAEDRGLDPWDWRTQIDFSVWELHNTESAALEAMRAHPDATPAEMARIVRKEYERPNPALARDDVRAQIAEETFNGNYGKYENGPRDTSFKDSSLDPNRVSREEPFRDEFIERDAVKGEEPHTDLNSFVENTEKKSVKNDDLGTNHQGEGETARTGEINDFQPKDHINTDFVENETPRIQEKTIENDINGKFRYEEDAPNVSLKNAIDELPLKARETIINELKDVVKNDASETRLTELENKVHSNTEILKDLNKATKPDIPKTELDAVKARLSEILDVPVESLNHEYMETVRRDRAAELITDAQELKMLQAEPAEGGVSKYAQQPSQLLDHATHEQVHEAVVKAFNGNEAMANRYLGSKGVRPTEPLQYNVMGKDTPHTEQSEGIERMGRVVSRREIIDSINNLFNQRIKTGRLGTKNAKGWYNPNSDVIRTGAYGDIPTMMHELGHYIDNHNGFSSIPKFDTELLSQVKKRFGTSYDNLDVAGKRKEGYAEFFKDYVSDRAKAKQDFPEFYKHFKETIERDKALNGIVNKLSKLTHEWHKQSSADRIKGSISFERTSKAERIITDAKDGNIKDTIKRVASDVYTKAIDELNPLREMVEEVEHITGEKVAFKDNPFMQAWLSRGWVGKAEEFIKRGRPEKGVRSFEDIIKDIPQKEHKDFSAYLVALHDLDLHRNGQMATFTLKEDLAAVSQYEKNPTFKSAAKDIHRFQDYMLAELVNNGILKPETYHLLRNKYPNYVPFFRDFSAESMDGFFSSSKGFVNVANPIKRFKGSTRDIIDPLESIVKNTYQFYNAIERNHVGVTFAKLAKKPGIGTIVEEVRGNRPAKSTDNTFSVWVKGKKVVYETTPELAQTMKMMNKDTSNFITKILQYPASWLRAGSTVTAGFAITNALRDTISAGVFSKHGFLPVVDTFRGLAHFLKKDQLYWDYVKSGGAHAAMVSLDRDYLSGHLRELFSRKSTLSKVVRNPIEVLRAISEATEVATRLGEFSNARKGYTGLYSRLTKTNLNPKSLGEASIASRDITIDFSRTGTHTKTANKVVAFFNATVQGGDKLVRAWRDDPKGMTIKSTLFITLPTIALWYLNKDNTAYQELPQWEKDTFFHIPAGDKFIKIPKPFELGLLYGTTFERMLQYFDDKSTGRNGVGFKGLGDRTIDTLLPDVLPTALSPIWEWWSNYSKFRQRNIVPQSQEKLPDKLQYGSNTSMVARKIGDTFNVSPYKVDNTIMGYGGNLARLGLDITDAIGGANEKRPTKGVTELPEIRRFFAKPYQSSDSVQRVYDDFKEQEKLHNELKLTGQRPEGYDPKLYNKLKNAQNSFKAINKASKKIIDSETMSSDAKREKLDKLNIQKANVARGVYGLGIIKE
uniref:Type I restriction enzyme Methylase n=1 Tax=Podoviridae sp. ctxOS2 TaxID=2826590 RepID=A0A8S5MB33_9CAUD|nr:MAG TPA: Type I restriction enzyme Methylase [Podoviridae sp. ctxOS2]